jgi:hypothetical protein
MPRYLAYGRPRSRPSLITIGLLALALAAGAGLQKGACAAPADVLTVPDRASANVSLAADQSFVVAVWSASVSTGATEVFAAISRDAGTTFGAPVRVNSTPGDVRTNGEQPPRVTLTRGAGTVPTVVVMWTARGAGGTRVLTSQSADGGRTFSEATLVPGTDAPGNRGWEAVATDQQGRTQAVWLDHRRAATSGSSSMPAGHQHGAARGNAGAVAPAAAPDGVAMAQKSDLYFDTLSDAAPPRAVTAGVCYCCKTAIAFGPAGEIYLAWRHVYPGVLRDMAFTVSRDGGRTFADPVRVSQDNWKIDGCPEDGPSLAVDRRGRIHIVWPTVVTEGTRQGKALFHAVSSDGRSFSPRVRIPTEAQPNHPQLAAAPDGSLLVVWDESGVGSRRIVLGRGAVDSDGRATFTRTAIDGENGVYPKLVATPAGWLAAWTSGPSAASVIRLARLP